MGADGIALFDTSLGRCGIAWSGGRVAGVQRPEADAAATARRLARRFPSTPEAEPPPAVAAVIDGIRALLRGEPRALDAVPLAAEDRLPEFDRKVLAATRTIPRGTVVTYGELAARLGEPGAAREVGAALGRNPFPLLVPCHRVVAAGGRLGGFSAAGGAVTKRRLLAIERARFGAEPDLFG